MPHYEVIYETGAHSVLSGESDDEVMAGLKQQHERARNGLPGQLRESSSKHPSHDEMHGPDAPVPVATHPAERVKRVLVYNEHPGHDSSANQGVRLNADPHESNFQETETREIDLTVWGIN